MFVFADLFKNFLSLFPVCNFDNIFMLKINLRINFIKPILAYFTPIIRLTQTNSYQFSQLSVEIITKVRVSDASLYQLQIFTKVILKIVLFQLGNPSGYDCTRPVRHPAASQTAR